MTICVSADVKSVLDALQYGVIDALQNGNSVRLGDLDLFRHCKYCGSMIDEKSIFCSHCGKLQKGDVQKQSMPMKKMKKSRFLFRTTKKYIQKL